MSHGVPEVSPIFQRKGVPVDFNWRRPVKTNDAVATQRQQRYPTGRRSTGVRSGGTVGEKKSHPGKMLRLVILGAILAVSSAQFQPTGRILEPPIPALCAQRTIHERFNGKGYYYSWADQRTAGQEIDWLSGRNFCRQRCMDLVSLETSAENEFIKSRIVQNNVKYIWTSGRLCDFKGCDRPDLQPLHINGWFWTAELQKLAPTNNRAQNDWSETGGIGKPQPDNREPIQQGGAPENCLAVLNQFYNDGVNWHDVACHHKKPWVCEENDSLLKYVRFTNPNLRV